MQLQKVYVVFWNTDWEHGYLGVTRYLSDALRWVSDFNNWNPEDVSYHEDRDGTCITFSTNYDTYGHAGYALIEYV